MVPSYAELHCVSNFSFLRGASHPEELVETAHALGYTALALTDECSLAGIVRAHIAAKEKGLELIVGTELELAPDSPARGAAEAPARLVLLATDRESYGNLSALITRGRRQAVKGSYRLRRSELAGCVTGCLAILLPPNRIGGAGADAARTARSALDEQLEWLAATLPGSAWLGVELLGEARDRARLADLRKAAQSFGVPCVACGDVHMHDRSRRALQDTLTAIRLKCTLAEAGYRLFPNGERHLRAPERLARIYPPELLAETLVVAARCHFSLDSLRYEYPEELVPAGETPASHLRNLTARGFVQRFGRPLAAVPGPPRPLARAPLDKQTTTPSASARVPPLLDQEGSNVARARERLDEEGSNVARARELVEHELSLIAELGYEPYFLTVHDIVAFARSRGILCQGRGSAANSAVCYCLSITEVDPMRMQVLFERFISRERNEPPDIDVDFEHQRREEVMQYVYGKYGRDRAALAATLITYRPKSAVRDVGKALGLELAQADRLAKTLAWWDRRDAIAERIREAGLDPDSAVMQRLVLLVETLIGFPRHLSQHVGGFVIARGRLDRMVPIENAAMPDRTVIQWDKDDLDALGLLKVDCLALGMLSAIRRALDLVNDWRARRSSPLPPGEGLGMREGRGELSMADVPPEDPEVYAMIRKADTIGVFQIESRAQMAMLPRLAPRTFYDLVIEVAIVRPGPIQGGMIHPYLRRRQQQEAVTYPSEAVKSVLERTLGVPIFQEQVMQLAIVAAGFTPGEADRLRRSMAAWRRKGGLWQFEQRLIDGMRARGYEEEFARQIFQQIQGFGEYGFPESHSASFALLVYVSAWLKCHHHGAFTCALLNSQPMGFYAPSQLVQDARRHGVEMLAVDVAVSDWDCTLENGVASQPALRLGMRMVKGLTEAAAKRIAAARQVRAFASVPDLAERAALDRGDLNALARAGALQSLSGHRRDAAWQVGGIERTLPLLDASTGRETPVVLAAPSEAQDIVADYRSLGLSLGRHPLELLRPNLQRRRLLDAARIQQLAHGRLARTAGIVTCRQRPDTASGVIFITLEDETGTMNVVVWRDLLQRQRREVLGARLLGVYGTIERQGEVVHLLAGHLLDLSPLLGALQPASRDFH
jgi:error-prone DNA polymerase